MYTHQTRDTTYYSSCRSLCHQIHVQKNASQLKNCLKLNYLITTDFQTRYTYTLLVNGTMLMVLSTSHVWLHRTSSIPTCSCSLSPKKITHLLFELHLYLVHKHDLQLPSMILWSFQLQVKHVYKRLLVISCTTLAELIFRSIWLSIILVPNILHRQKKLLKLSHNY